MLTCPTCQATYADGTTACPLDGAELCPPDVSGQEPHQSDPLVGQMLDSRLRVLRRIGEGGMGTVYAAEHIGLCKEVAVKVLGERQRGQSEVAARLRSEARLASAISNEHIVEVFDIGETADGRTFIVMELLHGESLAQRLAREGALGEQMTLRIGRQIAKALQAAHAKGIIHRDIKPENIFLCSRPDDEYVDEYVKVLDFGISKALRGAGDLTPRLTQTGTIMGTPLYMSPEQARGEEDLDHRIDIYSLGVVLYECLTGQVPFSASNYLGVVNRILTGRPLPPRQRRPDLPISVACEQLVMRAIAADRTERYQSIDELLADLDRVMAGASELVLPWSGESGTGRHLLVVGVGLLTAVVILLVAWSALSPPPAPPTAPATPTLPAASTLTPPPPAPAPQVPAEAPALAKPPPTPAGPRRVARHRLEPPLPEVLHDEQAPNPYRRRPR
ncbi:MAG: serine/threonine-protein kinase [Myxococcales bacterium]|nr:serine/threonine protein kinase [Myxococcota bacterium]MDW8280827.1 serine/threonine-protein kinase [Myxococcales bacterium]